MKKLTAIILMMTMVLFPCSSFAGGCSAAELLSALKDADLTSGSLAMVMSVLAKQAEELGEAQEESKEDPAEAPHEELHEDPAEAPQEEPQEEPAEAPQKESQEEPAEAPQKEPYEDPAEAPQKESQDEPDEASHEELQQEQTGEDASEDISEEDLTKTSYTEPQAEDTPVDDPADTEENKAEAPSDAEDPQPSADGYDAEKVIACGEKYLGVPYRMGGKTPAAFDCSGFILYVMHECGYELNAASAATIYPLTEHISSSEVRRGDLIFFTGTYATGGISHVGIYLGDGQMLHAGSKNVCITDLSYTYWRQHFAGYGRMIVD